MFKVVDAEGDSSGTINKKEFKNLAMRLEMHLTDHRIDEIFADIKKNDSNSDANELNEEEFESALNYL